MMENVWGMFSTANLDNTIVDFGLLGREAIPHESNKAKVQRVRWKVPPNRFLKLAAHPLILSQLIHGNAAFGSDLNHSLHQLATVFGHLHRHVVDASLNLRVEILDIVIVEGLPTADQDVEQDPERPNISLSAAIKKTTQIYPYHEECLRRKVYSPGTLGRNFASTSAPL